MGTKVRHPPNLFERGVLVKTPTGWPSRCTPTLTRDMCTALRQGTHPTTAAKQCGCGGRVLAMYLKRGEDAVRRGEENCYTQFFVAFMLALGTSPHARRHFQRDQWQRRYWIALNHVWLAQMHESA
jgi:hypothetical protein